MSALALEIEFRAYNFRTNEMLPHRTPSGSIYALEAIQYPQTYHLDQYVWSKDVEGKKAFVRDIVQIGEKFYVVGWCDRCKGYRALDSKMEPQATLEDGKFKIVGNTHQNDGILLG